MTNNKEVSMVRDNFGYILQHIMITLLLHNRDDIKEICSNDMERHILLGNTMKRLNTTYIDEFMIKDKNAQFINIMNAGQIIFDTGNANLCIVGIDFLKKLGYSDKDFKPMLETATSGVGKGSITYNRYIELTLKIDPKVKNTSLNKEYTFIAFVGMETLKDTLLLGQSAHSLRQFFQDSYCIGYNSDRVEYEKNKAQTNKDYNEINSILDELIQIHTNRLVIEKAIMMYAKLNTSLFTRFLQLVDNKTDLNKYDILINKLQQIKKLLESEPNKSVYGEIFNKIIGQYM
jgi:hypothetical protein